MSLSNSKRLRNERVFSNLLKNVAKKHGLKNAAQIAAALYDNNDCYKVIKPRGRTAKYQTNRIKDIGAISRAVQRHLDCSDSCSVPGNYMFAYHILFDCSLDYLYGVINDPYPNAEVKDISDKTGLSATVIEKMMERNEVSLDEFLSAADHYGFFDSFGIDSEDEVYLETNPSITQFWNSILESDCFTSIPENWYRMACALYTSKGIKSVAADAKASWDEMPSWDTFRSWKEGTWDVFHPDEPIFIPDGLSLKEAYDKYPEWVTRTYREMRYTHFYSAADKAEEFETAYWGCAGRFDRAILNFFHQRAEEWCESGPLPKIWD